MLNLIRIAEDACCAGCPTREEGTDCMYRSQGECDRLDAALETVRNIPDTGALNLISGGNLHIHFYVEDAVACRKRQAKARRRLEDLLRKDCALCERLLRAVGLPVE